jgi:hypothetical protein
MCHWYVTSYSLTENSSWWWKIKIKHMTNLWTFPYYIWCSICSSSYIKLLSFVSQFSFLLKARAEFFFFKFIDRHWIQVPNTTPFLQI